MEVMIVALCTALDTTRLVSGDNTRLEQLAHDLSFYGQLHLAQRVANCNFRIRRCVAPGFYRVFGVDSLPIYLLCHQHALTIAKVASYCVAQSFSLAGLSGHQSYLVDVQHAALDIKASGKVQTNEVSLVSSPHH